MGGIAGCYYRDREVNRDDFEKMVDIIDYRGIDDRGTYYDGKLALGYRRLAILDPSERSHQPFLYQERYVVVYNGEIYNYKELREELINQGYAFHTQGDTEVLIAAFDAYGSKCVEHFNGMWSFAIYDSANKIIFCSRDRFGVKPFYYYMKKGEFIFCSEIKQIFELNKKRFSVNRPRLLEYLILGMQDHTNETMIADVYQLKPGHNLIFDMNTFEATIESFYDLSKVKKKDYSFDKAAEQFRDVFEDSVKRRLVSDVPAGYCLSCNIDSAAVCCMADKIIKNTGNSGKQQSVSLFLNTGEAKEREYISEVIKTADIECREVTVKGRNVLSQLDDLLWHMDEPFVPKPVYEQWNVFKAASRNGLKVMLDSLGANEQLAGYPDYYSVTLAEYLRGFRFNNFKQELECIKQLNSVDTDTASGKVIKDALILAYMPGKLQKLGKVYLYHKRKMPFEPETIKSTIMGTDLYYANDSRKFILDNIKGRLSMLLHYEDRNSMAHSVEARVPFMDSYLVGCIFGMPIEYKLKDSKNKLVEREGLKDILPENIRNTDLQLDYSMPFEQWFDDNPELFKKEIEDACENLYPILHKDRVMDWFAFLEGKVSVMNYMPYRIICAGHWVKLFNLKV